MRQVGCEATVRRKAVRLGLHGRKLVQRRVGHSASRARCPEELLQERGGGHRPVLRWRCVRFVFLRSEMEHKALMRASSGEGWFCFARVCCSPMSAVVVVVAGRCDSGCYAGRVQQSSGVHAGYSACGAPSSYVSTHRVAAVEQRRCTAGMSCAGAAAGRPFLRQPYQL